MLDLSSVLPTYACTIINVIHIPKSGDTESPGNLEAELL